MKKYFGIIFFASLLALLLTVLDTKIRPKDEIPEVALLKAFQASGANVVSSEIYFWGRLKDNNGNTEGIKQIMVELLNGMEVREKNSFTEKITASDTVYKIQMKGLDDSGRLIEIIGQMDKTGSDDDEKTISISITEDLSTSGMETIRDKVVQVFITYGISPKINSCITGSFEGKLDSDTLNNVGGQVFEGVKAKKVEGIHEGSLISVSAYSPFIDECIYVNGKKVNLNLAIRYNSYEDKTYIWLATPVITIEY